MIHHFTATPQSLKAQLYDLGVDYTKITPYQLFYRYLFNYYPKEKTSVVFGDLDLRSFRVTKREKDDSVLLYQRVLKEDEYTEIVIDEFTYEMIADYLRQVHCIEKDERVPGNETTKMILIEDAKEELERSKRAEWHSNLKNLISAMVNSAGFKYSHSQVWDMKINAFMDSVKRISKIKNAELLLQSGYSGFGIDLKNINKKQIDWLGEL